MKLTVIGRWGAYPRAGEATAGFLLESGSHKILLDCGSGVLSVLQRFLQVDQLTAVVLSHRHYDHMADLGCLQYACLIDSDLKKRDTPLRILASEEAKGAWAIPAYVGTSAEGINEDSVIQLEGGLKLTFFRTDHEAYCLGVRAETGGKVLVYTSDTRYNESLVPFCRNADLLVTECSFNAGFDAGQYGHMNAHEAGRLAARAGAKELIITHLPHFGDIQMLAEEVKEVYSGKVRLADLGLVAEV